ncbi:deaminase [Streptomyces parvus]|uniref:deoxycytidylate deaminase n=1 Tax=Streptomyces parvus TaxID=66428 RepID=UPI0033F63695
MRIKSGSCWHSCPCLISCRATCPANCGGPEPEVDDTPAERPSWDEYYLAGAAWAATRADCTRAQVGAVLVSRDHRVSIGYNGLPAGIPGCATAGNCPRGQMSRSDCAPDSDYANCGANHAEYNAITRARPEDLPGSTLYVTRKPCPRCTTLIKAAGIARVVTPPSVVRWPA